MACKRPAAIVVSIIAQGEWFVFDVSARTLFVVLLALPPFGTEGVQQRLMDDTRHRSMTYRITLILQVDQLLLADSASAIPVFAPLISKRAIGYTPALL